MQEFFENIRLVIWDLDETFWKGTLEEGEVVVSPEVKELVPQLSRRGIVNSICSKNSMDAVQRRLEEEGLWEWFVFPRVAYAMKADLVADIVDQMGLRPPTVLFIDDNAFNRGEVAHQIPDLNIASEAIVPHLLEHPQLQGKPDPDLTRLQRYRVLQQKQTEIARASDPGEYLRSCGIKVSFHYDIDSQFDRVHDLVNRTNQLNFTKARWKENIDEAREDFRREKETKWENHYGYVKVSDKFGYYGICGFYQIRWPLTTHFLFSCRVLNMGVEQFVYQTLNYPVVTVEGKVATTLEKKMKVDWIEVVDDAEVLSDARSVGSRLKMSLRGPCELSQVVHYLRPVFDVTDEFAFPRVGWLIQRPATRYIALASELAQQGMKTNEDLGLPADFAGFDYSLVSSITLDAASDIRVLCFSIEPEISLYRHLKTGLLFPLILLGFHDRDIINIPTETLTAKLRDVRIDHIEAVKQNFAYWSQLDPDVLRRDVVFMRTELERSNKPVIIVEAFDNLDMLNRSKYQENQVINNIVRDVFRSCPLVRFIRINDCVKSAGQEVSPNHFQRDVYMKLSELIQEVSAEFEHAEAA